MLLDFKKSGRDHITLLFLKLTSVKYRIEYEIAAFAFRNLSNTLPLSSLLTIYEPQNKQQIFWSTFLQVPSPNCLELYPNPHSQL